jgi:hypothetical protein
MSETLQGYLAGVAYRRTLLWHPHSPIVATSFGEWIFAVHAEGDPNARSL